MTNPFGKKEVVDPATQYADMLERLKGYFKPAAELEIRDSAKFALYGLEKTGKTHFCRTAKRPMWVIDSEGSWNWEIDQMKARGESIDGINVSQVLKWANKSEGKLDLIGSLDALVEAIDLVTTVIAMEGPDAPKGTIVIDSMTDLWDWLGIWLDEIPGKMKSGTGDKMSRFEWGKANKRYIDVIYMLLHSNWNVIFTFRAKPIVDDKGGDTGNNVARWQKNTGYYVDSIIEMSFVAGEFQAQFHKGRLGKFMYGQVLRNPDWGSVVKFIKEKSGITIY
jgi:hypothetical protein